tara:strand:- start:145 stop:378 length:234 start_codon:yes stop_codon:yes gene_type:complete
MFSSRNVDSVRRSLRESEARSHLEMRSLEERVEQVEDAWVDTLAEIQRWRTWMTLTVFALAVTSLVLSGVYLGGVLL